jgi:hypothetical protein
MKNPAASGLRAEGEAVFWLFPHKLSYLMSGATHIS